jgi:hypothetical protein
MQPDSLTPADVALVAAAILNRASVTHRIDRGMALEVCEYDANRRTYGQIAVANALHLIDAAASDPRFTP